MVRNVKKQVVMCLTVLLMVIGIFMLSGFSSAAKISDNIDTHINLSPDKSIVDLDVLSTTLGQSGGVNCYNIDLKITNHKDKAVYVDVILAKVNGKAVNSQYRKSILNNDAKNSVRTRVNGSGAYVYRTAHIPFGAFVTGSNTEVKTIEGYVLVTDIDGNRLLGSNGRFKVAFEQDANPDDIHYTDTEIVFDHADVGRLNDAITINISEVVVDEDGKKLNVSYFNEDENDYHIVAKVGDDEIGSVELAGDSTVISSLQGSFLDNLEGNVTITFVLEYHQDGAFGRAYYTPLQSKDCTINLGSLKKYSKEKSHFYISGPETLYISGTAGQLSASVIGSGVVDANLVSWKSSDEDIAVVDSEGLVTAKSKAGIVFITAEYNGEKDSLSIIVKEPTLKISNGTVAVDSWSEIKYFLNPDFEANKNIVFESSDPNIMRVDNGRYLYGLKPGLVELTATYKTGGTATVIAKKSIRVTDFDTFGLNQQYRLTVGSTSFIGVRPAIEKLGNFSGSISHEIDSAKVQYKIEDQSIAEIVGAKDNVTGYYRYSIKGKKAGYTKLTAKYKGIEETFDIIVSETGTGIEDKPYNKPESWKSIKVPNITNGLLYADNNNIEIEITGGSMTSKGLELKYKWNKYKETTYETDWEVKFTSINGMHIDDSAVIYEKNKLLIPLTTLCQLGLYEIEEIRGYVSGREAYGYGRIVEVATYDFVIEPGHRPSTSYVRKLPSGKKIFVDNTDTGIVDIEITGISEVSSWVDYSVEPEAMVYFTATRNSDESIYIDGNVEKINGFDVYENIVFSDSQKDRFLPGEAVRGSFKIPNSTYMRVGRKINSMELDITVRDKNKAVKFNKTVTVDDLAELSIKSDELTVSCPTLYAGDYGQTAEVYNAHRKMQNKDVSWYTSDEKIITVTDDGVVYPLAQGKAYLIAEDSEGRMGYYEAEVHTPTMSVTTASDMYVGTVRPLKYEGHGIRKNNITITSSDEDVVKITSTGYLLALKEGEATITAKSSYTKYNIDDEENAVESVEPIESSQKITVKPITGINFDNTNISLYNTQEISESRSYLEAKVGYQGELYRNLYQATWESSNPNVVEVIPRNQYPLDELSANYIGWDEGYTGGAVIIAKGVGEATVTASYGGYTGTVYVNVYAKASGSSSAGGNGGADEQDDETDPTSTTPVPTPKEIHPGENYSDPYTGSQYTLTEDGGVKFVTAGSKVSKVVIPEYITIDGKTYPVTSIADGAFKNNKTITSLTIGKNVTNIGSNAFQGATKLKSINMKDCSIKSIGKNAFKSCKNLKKLTINCNSLTSVNKTAFKGITKEVKVTVFAKNKDTYNKAVKKLTKGGLKHAAFKFKKKK